MTMNKEEGLSSLDFTYNKRVFTLEFLISLVSLHLGLPRDWNSFVNVNPRVNWRRGKFFPNLILQRDFSAETRGR
jgi:hypothetical protein